MINSPKHNEFVQHPDWNRGQYYVNIFPLNNTVVSTGNWGVMDPVMPYYNGMSNLWRDGQSPVNFPPNGGDDDSFFPTYYSPINSRVYNSKIIYQTYRVNRPLLGGNSGNETFFSAPFFTTQLDDTVFTKGAIKFARCLIQFINIGQESVQSADINFVVELIIRISYRYAATPSPRTTPSFTFEKNILFPSELPPEGYNTFALFNNFGGVFSFLTPSIPASGAFNFNGSTYTNYNLEISNLFYNTDVYLIKTFVELR